MNKDVLKVAKLNKLLYKALFKETTKVEAEITTTNQIKIISDGDIKNIKITYSGSAKIQSYLPDGYYLKVNSNNIRIRNIMGKPLPNDGIIFRFEEGFFVKYITAKDWNLKTFRVKVTNLNRNAVIPSISTKFEDETSIINDFNRVEFLQGNPRARNTQPIVTGLYTNFPFPNGYTGYYHYIADKKIFMSGARPSPQSRLLFNKSINSSKTIANLKGYIMKQNKPANLKQDKYEEIAEKEVYKDSQAIDIIGKIKDARRKKETISESKIEPIKGVSKFTGAPKKPTESKGGY
tara:strand:- start:3870 stop:4745 length:876 start_codon:yes stop_codon:yes gene_type:complete